MDEGECGKIVELCDKENGEYWKYVWPIITTLDHFKGLYGYLKQRDMVPDFLAHGDMALVRKVIVETGLLETSELGECGSMYGAIALSLKNDRHDRAASLFEAASGRPHWKDKFFWFVERFFLRYPPEKDSMPLKRFLTLRRQEFNEKHPVIYETFCRGLVGMLRWKLDNPAPQKLLIDLVGQPSLLTPAAFAGGFFCVADDTGRANLIKYGYKEAIEEGLKEEYEFGGRRLWAVMVEQFPIQFSGEYPDTDEARTAVLKDFKPIKQDLEEQWTVNNAANPQAKLRMQQLAKFLDELGINVVPTVLWVIIAEYVTVPTLLDTE